MTLQHYLVMYYLEYGCAGNKSELARELDVERVRINNLERRLEDGCQLGSTWLKLICLYNSKGLSVDQAIRQWKAQEVAQKDFECMGVQRIDEARARWRNYQSILQPFEWEIFKLMDRTTALLKVEYCEAENHDTAYCNSCICGRLVEIMMSICDALDEKRKNRTS